MIYKYSRLYLLVDNLTVQPGSQGSYVLAAGKFWENVLQKICCCTKKAKIELKQRPRTIRGLVP